LTNELTKSFSLPSKEVWLRSRRFKISQQIETEPKPEPFSLLQAVQHLQVPLQVEVQEHPQTHQGQRGQGKPQYL